MTDRCEDAILIVAAGRGSRAGGGIPKQYREIGGRPVLSHTLRALAEAARQAMLQVVIHPDDRALYEGSLAAAAIACTRVLAPVDGGASRQESVRAGLEALAAADEPPARVLIHDAARPFVSPALVERAFGILSETSAAVPGLAVTDTIKQVDSRARVVATPNRDGLRAVQTPQSFRFAAILDAHRRAAAAGINSLSDDAAVAEWAGLDVHVFAGDPSNMKLTHPEDFRAAQQRLFADLPDVRTGQGFDVHAFAPGDHVWLGGVKVAHTSGLTGHSDADVLMHAITDAILGAIADGDIGSHFPPSDPQWKGAASDIFLKHAVELVRRRGGLLAHVDGTVICEAPKVGPHREAIRVRLAEIMGLEIGRVAVKATTSEELGFTGRREGIAALATATVRLPLA